MKSLLMLTLLAFSVFGQQGHKVIGEIEFFGYSGIDLQKLKRSLPFREGEEFRIEKKGALAKILQKAEESVRKSLARPATDIAPVCCDRNGNWIIYIGLSGKVPSYHPKPKKDIRLPKNIIDLYKRFESELEEAINGGAAQEDQTQGYALSVVPAVRKIQLEMREYALEHEDLVRDVLVAAAEDRHRVAAAEILGYARQSKLQVQALAYAARDENPSVRNNATRALWILVDSNPELAFDIPEDFYIDLLLSGEWSDLNKSSLLLASISKKRDKGVLDLLRRDDVQTRLIEMARWRTWHADSARYLLGRSAGIEEERLKALVSEGQTEEILKSLSHN